MVFDIPKLPFAQWQADQQAIERLMEEALQQIRGGTLLAAEQRIVEARRRLARLRPLA